MRQGVSDDLGAVESAVNAQKLLRLVQLNKKLGMEVGKLRGELAPISEYKQDVVKVIVVAKTRLLAIPSKVAPRLHAAQTVEEVQRLLLSEIREVLNELAAGVVEVHGRYDVGERSV